MIPDQVQQQQPIFLVDVFGKTASFDLDFIRSADVRDFPDTTSKHADRAKQALTSVLKSNFCHIPGASVKIDRGEFLFQDTVTKQEIDLSPSWELCFRLGQRITMSIIFKSRTMLHRPRPVSEIECQDCGIAFQTVNEVDAPSQNTHTQNGVCDGRQPKRLGQTLMAKEYYKNNSTCSQNSMHIDTIMFRCVRTSEPRSTEQAASWDANFARTFQDHITEESEDAAKFAALSEIADFSIA